MIDCFIIGFNDQNFADYVHMVASMGLDPGAYRDLQLAFIDYNNRPHRSIDMLNHFYFEDKPRHHRYFNSTDFLWPVITYLGTFLSRRDMTFDYINLFQLEKKN